MAIMLKCKMCGGDLTVIDGSTTATCEFCGSLQTIPALDDEKKLIQFERAERLRKQCDFDKAAGIYENIVSDFRQEAEAYWGLVLCKYGIEYVDDPASGKKIPTCHRSSFDSVMEDSNFEQALENADEAAIRVYRQEAKQIEAIRKGILEVSSNEQPYDVFICYKETDANGDRTVDSLLAQDIYDALTARDYRVFFSRITLEDKLGQAYEPYIFAALNSAKIMLAVGTCYAYYNAVWVKNEWSRYLKIVAQDKNKYLIPCYKGIDAYDIPKEFAHLQGQDMGKVGAIQDLLRGIEKILPKQKPVIQAAGTPAAPGVDSLLRRGQLCLDSGDWEEATTAYDKVLDILPESVDAYLGKLCAEYHVANQADLAQCREQHMDENPNFRNALRLGSEAVKQALQTCALTAKNNDLYAKAEALLEKASVESDFRKAAECFGQLGDFRDAPKRKANAEARAAELASKAAKTKKRTIISVISIAAVLGIVLALNFWILPLIRYNKADELFAQKQYAQAAEIFSALESYQDSADRFLECHYQLAEIELINGNYTKAAEDFAQLKDYRDSQEKHFEAYYRYAEHLQSRGDYIQSAEYFRKVARYSDAAIRYREAMLAEAERLLSLSDYEGVKTIAETLADHAEEISITIDTRQFLDTFTQALTARNKLADQATSTNLECVDAELMLMLPFLGASFEDPSLAEEWRTYLDALLEQRYIADIADPNLEETNQNWIDATVARYSVIKALSEKYGLLENHPELLSDMLRYLDYIVIGNAVYEATVNIETYPWLGKDIITITNSTEYTFSCRLYFEYIGSEEKDTISVIFKDVKPGSNNTMPNTTGMVWDNYTDADWEAWNSEWAWGIEVLYEDPDET